MDRISWYPTRTQIFGSGTKSSERVTLLDRTNNVVNVTAFGFIADFKMHMEKSSKPFIYYIFGIKYILKKAKLIDWNVFYDKTLNGKVLIYNRKYIQNANNIIYNLRTHGKSFVMKDPDICEYKRANDVKILLNKYYPLLYFINKIPLYVSFPYLRHEHKTKY